MLSPTRVNLSGPLVANTSSRGGPCSLRGASCLRPPGLKAPCLQGPAPCNPTRLNPSRRPPPDPRIDPSARWRRPLSVAPSRRKPP